VSALLRISHDSQIPAPDRDERKPDGCCITPPRYRGAPAAALDVEQRRRRHHRITTRPDEADRAAGPPTTTLARPHALPRPAAISAGSQTRPSDLEVRLHAPIPQVVIVRVIGTMHPDSVEVLTHRVAQQFDRATHVVLDLSQLHELPPCGVHALAQLHHRAGRRGVRLLITGADRDAVRSALRRDGLDRVLDLAESADTVTALLVLCQHRVPRTRTATSPPGHDVVAAGATPGTGWPVPVP
jgi:anti-anti-sigma factor